MAMEPFHDILEYLRTSAQSMAANKAAADAVSGPVAALAEGCC
jgi:hypothetical protein